MSGPKATVNVPGGVPKRQRKLHPKTKTGCKTCKIRKVKCDEAKPNCNRCTSTGRKCDGYPSNNPIQFTPSRSTSPSSNASSTLPSSLALTIPGTTAEKRSFQYFVTNTAADLSGYYNEEFWKGFVLKACWDNSEGAGALRHAVVGIAALHEEFERSSFDEAPYGVEDGFAMLQYSKAITHLRQSLTATKTTSSPLSALMSSALFLCFDTLRGSSSSAMVHLQSGLEILKDAREQIKEQKRTNSRGSGKGISREEEFIMEKYIAPLLVRLSVQAILYVDTRSIEEKIVMAKALGGVDRTGASGPKQQDDPTVEELAWKFESLEVAREKLNESAEARFRMVYVCDPQGSMSVQSPEVMNLNKTASRYHSMWTAAFSDYMGRHSAALTATQIRGATMLKIQHCILHIMNAVVPELSDPRTIVQAMNLASSFDKPELIESFATAVTLCRSLTIAVEAEVERVHGREKKASVFSVDLGVIGPLYYVATKCTVASIRAEALSLIDRWKGREGMWDSSMGGKLVRQFWEVESKFGNRGYNIYNGIPQLSEGDTQTGSTSSEGRVNSRSRGQVRLNMGDGGKWEWQVLSGDELQSIPSETGTSYAAGVEMDGSLGYKDDNFTSFDLEHGINALDIYGFGQSGFDHDQPIDGLLQPPVDLLPLDVEPGSGWMSMLFTQHHDPYGEDLFNPVFTIHDYGFDANTLGHTVPSVGFERSGSTPGSYTNTSDSLYSGLDENMLGTTF